MILALLNIAFLASEFAESLPVPLGDMLLFP